MQAIDGQRQLAPDVGQHLGLPHLDPARGPHPAHQPAQAQPDGRQRLTGFIVQVAGDALAFGFLCSDDAPEELMAFYMAARALLRARLALGHLHDGVSREPKRWLDQADQYLDLANGYAWRA